MSDSDLRLLAINIGNSRIGVGVFDGASLESTAHAPAVDPQAAADMIVESAHALDDAPHAAIVVASVNERTAGEIMRRIEGRLQHPVHRLGRELPIPLPHTLGAEHTTGQDRFLSALAAYRNANQACVVIDAGTAVTIDFVDGEGVFHGGAILPGARMMLRSLHDHTDALPDVELAFPDESEVYAKTTTQAMLNGVCYGIRGAVRLLVERYAERYGGYPQIVATGGDAGLLFDGDELVEHIVPDLALRGIAYSVEHALSESDAEAPGE